MPRSRKRHKTRKTGDPTLPLVGLCRNCHEMVHATFDNKQLERLYHTVDALRAAPELASYLAWIRKQPATVRFRTRRRK